MSYLLLLKRHPNDPLERRFVDKKFAHSGAKKIYLNAFKPYSHFQQGVEKLVLSAQPLRPIFTLLDFLRSAATIQSFSP